MTNSEVNETRKEGRNRHGGRSVVTGPSETLADNLDDLNDAATVTPPVQEATVEAHPVHIDQVFSILRNSRRRGVLRYLQTAEKEAVPLGTLAEQLAAWECDKEVSQITSSERKRVYVGLYQSHLPKMDEVGAVSYDKQQGVVTSGENRHVFEHYLPPKTNENVQVLTRYQWMLPFIIALFTLTLAVTWLLV